jgi:hypothetical protein
MACNTHAATVRPCQPYESHLPAKFHQRDTLARKVKPQFRGATSHVHPLWRVRELQLHGGFEPGVTALALGCCEDAMAFHAVQALLWVSWIR